MSRTSEKRSVAGAKQTRSSRRQRRLNTLDTVNDQTHMFEDSLYSTNPRIFVWLRFLTRFLAVELENNHCVFVDQADFKNDCIMMEKT